MDRFETIYGKKIEAPAFCENESDFYKTFVAYIKIASGGDEEEASMFITGIRVICHEYLALVLSGKMDPFDLPEDFVKREKEAFKEFIHFENEMMQEGGVPLVEGENGKVNIDLTEIRRRVNGQTKS